MEFAITFKGDISPERTVKMVKRAEEGGFDYAWFFDSHVLWPECYTTMAVCMNETSRMRFGPCVTNPGVRHWSVAASTFATLSRLSGGRFDMGVGRGDSSLRVLGRTPVKIDEMVVFSDAVRRLVRGEKVVLDEKDCELVWAGHDMPVWFAAYGPKALAATGAHADGLVIQLGDPWLVKWFSDQAVAARQQSHHDGHVVSSAPDWVGDLEAASHSSDKPAPLRIMAAAPVWVGPVEEGRVHTRWFPAMVGNHVADLVERYGRAGGHVPRRLTDYIEGRKGYDYRHHAKKDADHLDFISDEIVESFSLIGPPEKHVEHLRQLEEAGVTQFNIYLMCGEEERILDAYIDQVLPHFK